MPPFEQPRPYADLIESRSATLPTLPISVIQIGLLPTTRPATSPDPAPYQPRADLAPHTLTLPLDWNQDPFRDRNWCSQMHMLRMADSYLIAFELTGDPRFLHWPVALLLDWQQFHGTQKNVGRYAWEDKTTGHRAAALAYVLAAASVVPGIASDEELERLRDLAIRHAHKIRHVIPMRLTNHTFDAVVGLRALAEVLPEAERPAILTFVRKTFIRLIRGQYTPGGLHKENSPGYHSFVTRTKLPQLMAARWFDEYVDLAALKQRADAVQRWFRTPENRLLVFGDTDGHPAEPPSPDAPTETGLFNKGGYVIQRDRHSADETSPPDAYFALMASALSPVHKHNDDLSYVWYDGCEIVGEAGKYAYKTSAMRTYAMSVRAHNTIECDERNPWPQLSEEYPAYGNAVRFVKQSDGFTLIAARVAHTRLGIAHARTILYRPGGFVLVADVIDDLEDPDGGESVPHTLTQWTHFASAIKLKRKRKGAHAFGANLPDGRRLAVAVASDQPGALAEVIRGQTEPRLQGWTSPRYLQIKQADALGLTHAHTGQSHLGSCIAIGGEIGKLVWTGNKRLRATLGNDVITLTPGHGTRKPSWRINPKAGTPEGAQAASAEGAEAGSAEAPEA